MLEDKILNGKRQKEQDQKIKIKKRIDEIKKRAEAKLRWELKGATVLIPCRNYQGKISREKLSRGKISQGKRKIIMKNGKLCNSKLAREWWKKEVEKKMKYRNYGRTAKYSRK